MQDPPIKAAETAGDLERVGGLFLEYTRSGDFDLCFQDFPRELAGLPGEYAPPFGTTLLALTKKRDGRLRCVAGNRHAHLRNEEALVREAFRGIGVGRRLAGEVIVRARALGYSSTRLDTAPSMV